MGKESMFSVVVLPALIWAIGPHKSLLLLTAACLLAACGATGAAWPQVAQNKPASSAPTVGTEYPEPLHGRWMPKDMACPSPLNYDSDSLIVIDQAQLAHYEDGNKPIRVRHISNEPQAWVIESLLNIAGDGYDTPVTEVFVLGGGGLTIVGKDEVGTYHKCD